MGYLPKYEATMEELEDYARCPRYFKFKYIDRLRVPMPLVRIEAAVHRQSFLEAIRDDLSLEDHLERTLARLEENEDRVVYTLPRRTMKEAQFRARLLVKLWHRILKYKMPPGPYRAELVVPMKICRPYTIHVKTDLRAGGNIFCINSSSWYKRSYTIGQWAHGLLLQTNGRPKLIKLHLIDISLVSERDPITLLSLKHGTLRKQAIAVADDLMDMMNRGAFGRLVRIPMVCNKVVCEYWKMCWQEKKIDNTVEGE